MMLDRMFDAVSDLFQQNHGNMLNGHQSQWTNDKTVGSPNTLDNATFLLFGLRLSYIMYLVSFLKISVRSSLHLILAWIFAIG